jgi:hypothetical protein
MYEQQLQTDLDYIAALVFEQLRIEHRDPRQAHPAPKKEDTHGPRIC